MKNLANIYLLPLMLLMMTFASSCQKKDKNPISLQRYEKELFTIEPDSLTTQFPELVDQNPEFSSVFCKYIIGIGPTDNPNIGTYLSQFLQDPVIREVYNMTTNQYPEIDQQSEEIGMAVNQFNKLAGKEPINRITTFISGFNQSFVTLTDQIAIGLDNYLGSDCRFYQQLGLPEYIKEYRIPGQITPDAVRAWITSEIQPDTDPKNLLSKMISDGIIYYAARQVLPKKYTRALFRYSDGQWNWCIDNEKAVWTFLIEQELLFSSDQFMIRRLTEEAPFTREFGSESPPRIGSWMGYRIVEQLMKKKKWTVKELISQDHPETILAQSGYHPG